MINRAFGVVLRKLREESGLSQERFGFEVGLHRTYVSQLERGLKSPSLSTLYKISQFLKIKPSTLVTLVEKELKIRNRR